MRSSVKKLYDLLPEGDVYKIGLLFLMMIFSSFLALLGVGMVPVFVSAVIDAERVLNHPLAGDFLKWIDVTTASELTIFGSFLLFAIYLFKNLYMLFYDYVHQKFMLNRQHFLQNRMFRAYMNSPYTFFIDRNSSELLRNINDEITKILRGTLRPIFFVTLNSLMALVIVAGLVVVEPLITGLGILFFGGFSYIFLRMTRDRLSYYGSESLRHRKSMTKAVLEGLHGFKDARVLSRENYFLNSFRGHSFKHKNYDIYQNILNVMPRRIIEMIALSGILFIAIVMVAQGRETTAIVPMIALYGAAVMKVRPSMNLVIENINQIRYNVHSVDAVYKDLKLLESYENRSEADEDVEKLALHSEIELRDVWFSYPNSNEPAVKNINLTIPKNSAVAFVGPSGAGKTTLVDVILGLLEPQEGAIQIDGADLFSNRNRWQKNIGYIPQFIYLLDDTVRRNICFGVPDEEIDEKMLQTAIETAQLSELVENLPDGVETKVGERGIRLSGGQRQRIGIARALYRNPQVLVMDEATSALDNITERVLIDAIERLRGDKTLIMIAHRLTTVQNCDTIYMLKDAEIIAEGAYSELLVSSKEFREMSLVDEEEVVSQ